MSEPLLLANLRVDESKIVDYLLSRSNSHGKAAFFLGFGFLPDAWESMSTTLKQHARIHPISAAVDSPHGTRYSVDGELETPSGRRPRVRTVWIRETDSDELRLITAHPI
ncbi:MAG: hypothetical protein Q8J96_04840 [Rhodocyclaceae bacterium]|nr:hypothetical protein [Rhodocyclaceae bacterium]